MLPKAPEIVLLGLMFVNFGPLIIFPTIKPPTSDEIHPNKIIKSIILICIKLLKKIIKLNIVSNAVQKKKI